MIKSLRRWLTGGSKKPLYEHGALVDGGWSEAGELLVRGYQKSILQGRLNRLSAQYKAAVKAKKKRSHILAEMQDVRHALMKLEAGEDASKP